MTSPLGTAWCDGLLRLETGFTKADRYSNEATFTGHCRYLADRVSLRTVGIYFGSSRALPASSHRLVIDGDGIKPLVQAQASRFAVRMRLDRGQLTVLTPLTLEASRFPGTSAVKVQADRLASAGTADGLADMMTTDRAAGSGIHEAASRAVYLYG